MRPNIGIINLANLKIMFCWRNQIYRKCNNFNASNIDDFQWLQLLMITPMITPWCSGYHYCTTSFIKTWTQVLRRFKSCSRRVGDSRWWGSLTMVPAENKAKRLSSVNHTTKTIHHSSSIHRTLLYERIYLVWW